ncbi:MAG: gamma-glutamyltransferase family protein [Proteobacteria bacterium]|nr:gamma-glutamyltransferase family protein [Pseudomonadota bacterium]
MLRTLMSPRGAVTAPHHLAAQAGAGVLRDGGNAVEAMVAAAATIAVVYPHMNSIGGDGFWLISRPGKAPVAIDACGRSAALATQDWYARQGHAAAIPTRGPLAANTVAGAVSGWKLALEQVGTKLPLRRLLDDAIWYASVGTPVTQSQVDYTTKFLGELGTQPGYGATFLHDGRLPRAGALQRFPALGETLSRLARDGLDDYYRGGIAQAIAAELERLGSPVRADDLARHQASVVRPLAVELSAGTLYNLPPPTQGLASLMILALFDRIRGDARLDSFEHVHGLVEATKQAFLVRNRHVCDPAVMRADPASFLLDDALAERARAIDPRRARAWPEPAIKGDTVWMGAADKDGCMVSYIQSVYWEFGSGVVLADTGINWQNRGASFSLDPASHLLLAPGRKPFHTLNPALARLNDGREMVYGNMGGDGQPQSQAAVFSRHVLFGQDLQQAVSAPRWLLGRTWGDMSVSLKVESRLDPAVVAALRDAGHDVEIVEPYSDLVGHAGALVRGGGVISGAADPRSDGVVATY